MKGGGNITTERERQLPEENVFDPQVAEWSLQRECRGWTKLYHHNEGRVAGSDFTLLYLLSRRELLPIRRSLIEMMGLSDSRRSSCCNRLVQ